MPVQRADSATTNPHMNAYTPKDVFDSSSSTNINDRIRPSGPPAIQFGQEQEADGPPLDSPLPSPQQEDGIDEIYKDVQLPHLSEAEFGSPRDDEMKKDIVNRISGAYRVFDLINEKGSGGLVDKIIIDQDGLERLINDLRPGAYTAMTRVDFKVLDSLSVRPIGVYGDRDEIINLLSALQVVDETTVQLLRQSKDDHSGPRLRSGIYIIRPPKLPADSLYAIYWPQDTTWLDKAPSSPRRNRITFMRYLTKISDQIICLISSAQSQAFVWDHQEEEEKEEADSMLDMSDDDDDRMYAFEITTRNEQEESVVPQPGFRIESPLMQAREGLDDEGQMRPPPPKLMLGECSQAFLSAQPVPPRIEKRARNESFGPMLLQKLLRSSVLRIKCQLDVKEISALTKNGLDTGRYKHACLDWQDRQKTINEEMGKEEKDEMTKLDQQLVKEESDVAKLVMSHFIRVLLDNFPTIDPGRLSIKPRITSSEVIEQKGKLVEFLKDIQAEDVLSSQPFKDFTAKLMNLPAEFLDRKHRIACVHLIFTKYPELANEATIRSVIKDGSTIDLRRLRQASSGFSWAKYVLPRSWRGDADDGNLDIEKEVESHCRQLSDGEFLANLKDYAEQGSKRLKEPLVEHATRRASQLAYDHFASILTRTFGSVLSHVLTRKREFARRQVTELWNANKQASLTSANDLFCKEINSISKAVSESYLVVIIESMQIGKDHYSEVYDLTVRYQYRIKSTLQYSINKLEIPEDHRHSLQLDPSFIPQPSISQQGSIAFTLPARDRILHAQLLSADRVLFVVEQGEKFGVYLDNIYSIGNTLRKSTAKKSIDKGRLGSDILVAFDETKRLMVVCAPQKATLHVFLFDERFSTLQRWANPFELAEWYNNQEMITHICFMSGTEELLLVDSGNQARIFSFVSQRFRPASVSLPGIPLSAMSSPDAACALLVFEIDDQRILKAYHWDTFGASEGITIILPVIRGSVSVTSFIDRRGIHLMMLDETDGHCESLALTITKKSSEFMFKEKGARVSVVASKDGDYTNNCLIDCFADVWTRFPVVAAVSRHSTTSSTKRQHKSITFISDQDHDNFAPYFGDMVRTFKEQTQKPTGDQLENTTIDAITLTEAIQDLAGEFYKTLSQFPAGEWFVNLLCLLPIHIAVARDNRFIPLKDGISSADFERTLLGAEVGRIVDSLSFGWYESILRSYMVDKPVRVVSSMGEQSVGKSFALNHLMDTSFAGSAMRTTEGVWMSVTPTDEAVLVALDFEGVHSIERSPQEDALLVLFNTAISNLVLFRNNFAISRDIADLFQSFQASSVILDPAANPSLFQSTLVVIIKDVIESDQREIVREFSSKFQRIVQAEQGSNFISKLHAGRLNIIPWPVIESSQFYTLYSKLKRRLDVQKVTHPSAGEFLYTLKILMAKLKANDWSAMSQSLSAHRAQTMLAILPVALQYGLSETGPGAEPLKNLDNDAVIDCLDTNLTFFLSSQSPEASSREAILADLRSSWEKYGARHTMDEATWMNELTAYLNETVKLRIVHVEAWITVNLQRFKSSNVSVELLQREMANAAVDLQANVDLCKMTCASCHLSCTLSRRHDPSQQPHNCNTDHRCPHVCDFPDGHPDEIRTCRSPAGHDGPHICKVDLHLCGAICIHYDKKGCQQDCTKMFGHEDDHVCSARKHACGKLCVLQVEGKYTCEGTCSFPSDEPHDQHVCDNRMCPLTCELCKRLCGSTDHLHGLDAMAAHLCGDTHRCQELCSAGICEIDTAPQSVQATFAGQHESFQYTKYSQAAKRLPCKKPIPAWKLEHQGHHIHSLDKSPFHFCETRCENCGYFCTLPRGHTQKEHETSHGSMSKTRWAVEGPDGTAMELGGRRFGANDEGAPMMCNLVCQNIGRHAHIDYCRTDKSQRCSGQDHEHISTRLEPNPDKPKDWISHKLYWSRTGFKDPYSRDDQATFAMCDSMCSGPEHAASANQPARPSYCTLPLFHPSYPTNQLKGLGYVSNDGHLFSCKNPVVVQQAFHVIFVIDRSGSMYTKPSRPLPATPITPKLLSGHNNRLGAVYLSLHEFWQSRHTALAGSGNQGETALGRRDAYSVILFNHEVTRSVENDFQRTPGDLLQTLLGYYPSGWTDYRAAVLETEKVLRQHWSGERSPVVIFLSDGECSIEDSTVRTLCRASVSLGKPLSLHAVSFGQRNDTLRRMAQIAREVESAASGDAKLTANAHIESSYAEALDSVQLADTFLGIADSLKKTRGALLV